MSVITLRSILALLQRLEPTVVDKQLQEELREAIEGMMVFVAYAQPQDRLMGNNRDGYDLQ